MQNVTYSDMVVRHGQRPALNLLYLIERMAQIRSDIISLDMDARFERAFKTICEIDFA